MQYFVGDDTINFLSLEEYLMKNNIKIYGEYFKRNLIAEEKDVLNQIALASKIQKILRSYKSDGSFRINSTIGRKIEHIKVQIKRLNKDLKRRENKNYIDEFLISKGNNILKQGKTAVNEIYSSGYLNLIRRSMQRNEICLGRIDNNNLFEEKVINIGTIKNISYNLIEEDIYNYLRKIRRENNKLNMEEIIDSYIELEGLSRDSKLYIEALLKVPYESLKYWSRYVDKKLKISEEKFLIKIQELYDSEIILRKE